MGAGSPRPYLLPVGARPLSLGVATALPIARPAFRHLIEQPIE